MGNNGAATTLQPDTGASATTPAPIKPNINRFVLGLFPFTPVPFAGADTLLAAGRIAGYSLLAYATYNKMRPASYIFMGAAGVSLATSLTSGLWGKK